MEGGSAAETVSFVPPGSGGVYSAVAAAAAARSEEDGGVGPPGSGGVVAFSGGGGVPVIGKKRGRPRKYDHHDDRRVHHHNHHQFDDDEHHDESMALALTPISVGGGGGPFSPKRGRGRPPGSGSKQRLAALGEWVSSSAGGGFTPHVITIAAGEDITMKIMSFSQKGPRAICILSANGAISNVTLRQPDSSGGTLTYEGRFEILSLSGSYMLTENGGTKSRTGGLSVSLASPDGRVVGGGVAGLLTAASPVQVVVGSFMPNHQKDYMKTPKYETMLGMPQVVSPVVPTAAVPISSSSAADHYDGHMRPVSAAQLQSPTGSSSYRTENWNSIHLMSETREPSDVSASTKAS